MESGKRFVYATKLLAVVAGSVAFIGFAANSTQPEPSSESSDQLNVSNALEEVSFNVVIQESPALRHLQLNAAEVFVSAPARAAAPGPSTVLMDRNPNQTTVSPSAHQTFEWSLSDTPSQAPSHLPSRSPSETPSLAPSHAPPITTMTTGYFLVWHTRGTLWGCQDDPQPAMEAGCGENATLTLLEHPANNHDCQKVQTNAIACAPQGDEGAVVLRCESDTGVLEDLILRVTMPSSKVTCDGCYEIGNTNNACILHGGDALQRLFLLSACGNGLYTLEDDYCSGVSKHDNSGNVYCEQRNACRSTVAKTCDATVLPLQVTSTAPLIRDGGNTCVKQLGIQSAPTEEPSIVPSFHPSFSSWPTPAPSTNPTIFRRGSLVDESPSGSPSS